MPAILTRPCSTAPSPSQQPVVLLCSDGPDWHARQLTNALKKQGAHVRWVAYTDCAIVCTQGQGRIEPGHVETTRKEEVSPAVTPPPAAVISRCLATGSLEQITTRLGILHGFEQWGSLVFNQARAIERTVDKGQCSLLLSQAGLPVAPTLACESRPRALAFIAEAAARGHKTVLKPLFGAQGKHLRLISTPQDLPPANAVGGVYHLQYYIGAPDPTTPGQDFRVMVVGGTPVAAMRRIGADWITNVAQGGRCEAVAARGTLATLAVAAARALGTAYAGVDMMPDPQGQWHILEVNSIPAWKGLQKTTSVNMAAAIASHVMTQVRAALAHNRQG